MEDKVTWKIRAEVGAENSTGKADVILELTDEFQDWFKESQGLKRWSNRRFNDWILDKIDENLIEEEGEHYLYLEV